MESYEVNSIFRNSLQHYYENKYHKRYSDCDPKWATNSGLHEMMHEYEKGSDAFLNVSRSDNGNLMNHRLVHHSARTVLWLQDQGWIVDKIGVTFISPYKKSKQRLFTYEQAVIEESKRNIQ